MSAGREQAVGGPPLLDVRVMQIAWRSPTILAFELASLSGVPLPGFQAGAHISVHLPVAGKPDRVRAYSLVNVDPANDTSDPQASYRIAVRRDEAGAGGSRQLHESVRPGDLLRISHPKNDFPLECAHGVTLLAGGIGVTPIASMAAALRRRGASFDFFYAVRTRGEAILLAELESICGDGLRLHVDETAGHHLDVLPILRQGGPRPLYVCGPRAMIDAVAAAAEKLGWPSDAVRFELFGADAGGEAHAGYDVVLKHSDRTLHVRPGASLLDTLIDEDVDLTYDCRAGFCGLCRVKVLEGEVVHRDTCLTEDERTGRGTMQACVSHAAGARLVLDL